MSESTYGEPIHLQRIRATFVKLHEQETYQGEQKGYAMTLLVEKSDKKALNAIKEALCDVAGVDSLSDMGKHPMIDDAGDLRDGDHESMAKYDGYKGCVYFKVSSNQQPECYLFMGSDDPEQVTDLDTIKREFYDGAYYDVILTPSMFEGETVDRKTKETIGPKTTFYLVAVMKVEDGKRLGAGSVDAKAMFLAGLGKSTAKGNKAAEAAPKKKTNGAADALLGGKDEEEEEDEKPKAKRGRPAKAKAEESEEEEEEAEEEEEEEEEKPKAKKTPPPPAARGKTRQAKADISDILN